MPAIAIRLLLAAVLATLAGPLPAVAAFRAPARHTHKRKADSHAHPRGQRAAVRGRELLLRAVPTSPLVGQSVQLSVENSPPGVVFHWDWTGPADGLTDTGSTPMTSVRLLTPGAHRLAAHVVADGRTRVVSVVLRVRPAPAPVGPRGPVPQPASVDGGAPAAGGPGTLGRDRTLKAAAHAVADHVHRRPSSQPAGTFAGARPADRPGDPLVAIADFHFTPGTLTVHVGDTVTWTNRGPSPHTATASNGSFKTGVLNKGQSASITFRQPGTLTYSCSIHPFMHGTIVVLAAAAKAPAPVAGAGTGSGGGSTSPGAPTSTASGPSLPATGANTIGVAVVGLILSAVGISLRRMAWRVRSSPPQGAPEVRMRVRTPPRFSNLRLPSRRGPAAHRPASD